MPVIVAGTIWGVMNLACILFFSYAPLLLVAQGSSPTVSASLTSLAIWFTILAIPSGGYLVHRSGKPIVAIIACGLIAALALMLFVADVYPTISCLVFGLAIGPLSGAILSLPAKVLEPGDRSLGFGLFYTCFYVLVAVGPSVAGSLAGCLGIAGGGPDRECRFAGDDGAAGALLCVAVEARCFRSAGSGAARRVVTSLTVQEASHRQRLRDRRGSLHRVVGIEFDLQSALPAIEEHAGMAERRRLDRNRHALFLAERADAADMIAGEPFGIGRAHHPGRLAAERRGKFFHADFAIRGHHDADRLAVDLGHQRLQHPLRLDAERFGGLQADAFRIRIVLIECAP